jgi:hypothetical protein
MCSVLWTYEPLTNEEIIKYWNSLTYEEQIEEIRKLDLLEHIPPEFEMFNYLALLTKDNELVIYPEIEIIEVKHVYLLYEVKMPTFHIENFVVPAKKKYILAGLSGGIIAVFGTIITGEEEWWRYLIGGCGGISIGILIEYLFR